MCKLNVKIIAGCALLTFFVTSSFGQVSTISGNVEAKKHALLDKNKVPRKVTYEWFKEYDVPANEQWYDFDPAFAGESWEEYDPFLFPPKHAKNYLVEFKKDNVPYYAVYTETGEKVVTHRRYNSALPNAISAAINNSEYKTWKIGNDKEEIFRDKDSDKLKFYKVSVERGSEKHILYFQQDGKLLKDIKLS